jgi:hypothetical protein
MTSVTLGMVLDRIKDINTMIDLFSPGMDFENRFDAIVSSLGKAILVEYKSIGLERINQLDRDTPIMSTESISLFEKLNTVSNVVEPK